MKSEWIAGLLLALACLMGLLIFAIAFTGCAELETKELYKQTCPSGWAPEVDGDCYGGR